MTKLSIIVPCYNCEKTLEEAVESVFSQAPAFPFDVTMVDDGSTDATYDVMRKLARRHRRIRLLRNEHNRGGGAARNAAAAASDGDLLFCVDSDDILGPRFLENMTRFWRTKRCDGVGMSTSVKFTGPDPSHIDHVTEFERPGEPIRFESFLGGSKCALDVVFLITRRAFRRIGGYPIEHGFDTQGIAFRFLCHGLTAYTCPETKYFHRVGLPRSYYMREQQAGRINWNWFNVLDEFLYVFRDSVKARLLSQDLFDVPGRPAPAELLAVVRASPDIYTPGYRRLVALGPAGVAKESRQSQDRFRQYWLGNFHRLRERHTAALTHYSRAIALGFDYRIVYYRMLQAELALAGGHMNAAEALGEITQYTQPFPLHRRPLHERIFHRLLGIPGLRGMALGAKRLRDRVRARKAR